MSSIFKNFFIFFDFLSEKQKKGLFALEKSKTKSPKIFGKSLLTLFLMNYFVNKRFIRLTKSAGSAISPPPTNKAWSSNTFATSSM